jgi:GTP diphosphokinase / guanosine-3',5'-bis(diphosphate) 3'-diphosphatase
MDFDLDRSPRAALTALRWVEDVAHRVRRTLVRSESRSDPVAYLIRTHRRIHARGDAKELRRAYVVAEQMHQGQLRKSGEPYITHPLAVAQILAELGMDTTTLVAALLHDTVEDTSYTMDQLRADFGREVALVVDGVTKFERAFYGEVAEVETIRKMIVAAGADVRVLIVKLADRLHNMRTIEARSVASRVRIARATQDVLIPLCHRLGIQVLKRELEDSVLAALEPAAHRRLEAWVAHRPEWTAYTDAFIAQVTATMRDAKIPARVVARPHHLYTIWSETFAEERDEPYELPRVAIILPGATNDCYAALGVVHNAWRPVPSRFKDFIGSPKNNLYRSLHTTVIGPDARAIEIQIRTEAMDRDATYGIVAGFRFARRGPGAHRGRHAARAVPRGRSSSSRGEAGAHSITAGRGGGADHLDWLHNLVQWQASAVDPLRFIESLRCDLTEGQVHVFVAGHRLLLPANATPVDVAYALSPDIGDRCIAATVNGQLTFLSSPLADGDVVEIHTEDGGSADGAPAGPSPEWLTFVRTPAAQLHIEQRLGIRESPETAPPLPVAARARIGLAAIRMELRRRERRLAGEGLLLVLSAELGYPDPEALCVAVADHTVSAGEIAERLIEHVEGEAIQAAVGATKHS